LYYITDHGWYFAKLDIGNILVLDFFGGANEVSTEDYFKATPYWNWTTIPTTTTNETEKQA
jgi:hypothetical protein